MNFGEFQEKKSRGTFDFPIELHHVTKEHPRYQMPFHWHMDYELIRVLKGSLVLSLNEETLNLTENSGIVLVCDGVLHGGMPVDCVYECLDFDLNEFLRGCSAGKKDIDDVQSHRIILDDFFAVDSEEYQTANRLFDTFIEEKKGYEFIIQGLLFELMGQILGNHRYKVSDDETYKSLKRIRQLKRSLKIIREEYMNQLTLGNLAEAADMSPKYFCRFFSEMTGKTPIEYLNYYRIECAAEQLLYTDDLVTDIALNCGYNDLSYFVKTFKKYKAQTPKQFRKNKHT